MRYSKYFAILLTALACGEIGTPTSTGTQAATMAQQPMATNTLTPTVTPTPDQAPVIKNLMVEFDRYDPATGRAGAFVFTRVQENKVFFEFGAVVIGPEGRKMLPTFEYRVAPDTLVYAVSDGIVRDVDFQAETNDYEIRVKVAENSSWLIVYDHVKDVRVAQGNLISTGQVLGTAGSGYNGLARTELQILHEGQEGINYCPFAFFDPALAEEYERKVTNLMADWEMFMNDTAIYDESHDLWPGCPYEKLIERNDGTIIIP